MSKIFLVTLSLAAGLGVSTPAAFAQSSYIPYQFSTLAGVGPGTADGTGSNARFYRPYGAAADKNGNVFVSDTYNHTIRKITAAGVVTTFAGLAENAGSDDGTGSAARFNQPDGLAVDNSGNVYVGDSGNHTIRQISRSGDVTTLAGLAGNPGSFDGTGSGARFNSPSGVAVDNNGNVYVADSLNYTIRKVSSSGAVTTLAGLAGNPGSIDGTGSGARFYYPAGLTRDGSGNLYTSDYKNNTVRKITSAGVVTTVAGLAGVQGSNDGTGSNARFSLPDGIAVGADGNVYVADSGNHIIRRVTTAGVVTTLAGLAGNQGSIDGNGGDARFRGPEGIAADSAGNLYVADTLNWIIRKIDTSANVTTLAGLAGAGSADGIGSQARFYGPTGVAVDKNGIVYVVDQMNDTVRKISPGGVVTTIAGSPGLVGSADGTGGDARFNLPIGVAVDNAGNLYISDTLNYTVRKITPAGVVTTLAGLAGVGGSADGTGSDARFYRLHCVAVDSAANVYVADTSNRNIRKITPDAVVTTLAGCSPDICGAAAGGTADGQGTDARFSFPVGIAVDGNGYVYVADIYNRTIRKITPTGYVTTLAGLPTVPGSTDSTGAAARFYDPQGVGVDSAGNVYVADTANDTIRRITPAAVVNTLGGLAGSYGSEDGYGYEARFHEPESVVMDNAGNLYVADEFNHTIRIGRPAPLPRLLATRQGGFILLSGQAPANADVEISAASDLTASFTPIATVTSDGNGNYQFEDTLTGVSRFYRAAIPIASASSRQTNRRATGQRP